MPSHCMGTEVILGVWFRVLYANRLPALVLAAPHEDTLNP